MDLTPQLGKKIIREIKNLISEHIIMTNKQAIIIASTDDSRIGHFHEGAEQTIKRNTVMVLTKEHETTMQGVRSGINLPIAINEKVIGVIGITGNPTEVIPFGSLMKKMTELLIKESLFIQESEWKSRAFEAFVFDWLQLNALSTGLIERAEILGINLNLQRRCLLISIHPKKEISIFPVISQLKQRIEQTLDGIIIRWRNGQLLVLSIEEPPKSNEQMESIIKSFQNYVSDNLQVNVSVGVGKIVEPNLIKESYSQAEQALKVAKNKDSIVFYENLLLEICLNDVQTHTKEEFIRRLLGPIQQDPVLLKTLKSFLDNDLHLKTTAEELHIHINTLHYRLKRVDQLTCLDPKKSDSVTSFFIAFRFLDESTN